MTAAEGIAICGRPARVKSNMIDFDTAGCGEVRHGRAVTSSHQSDRPPGVRPDPVTVTMPSEVPTG
jgi:hypothetical protein